MYTEFFYIKQLRDEQKMDRDSYEEILSKINTLSIVFGNVNNYPKFKSLLGRR